MGDCQAGDTADKGLETADELTLGGLVRMRARLGDREEEPGDGEQSPEEKAYQAAFALFKARNGGRRTYLSVLKCGGVLLRPDGFFRYIANDSAIKFAWIDAHRLIYRADAVVEQAREWWPSEFQGGDGEAHPGSADPKNDYDPRYEVAAEARPHLDRVYAVMTSILAAIGRENDRIREADAPADERRSTEFDRNLEVNTKEIERSEGLLYAARQREAQTLYGKGMVIGAVFLAGLCILVGAALAVFDLQAADAVALPAGAIGALVSVLQRMTRKKLRLDVHADDHMIEALGAVRPFVGGVLGIAVFCLFASGVLPSIQEPAESELAFNALIGFLAGFNERFAQDMLAVSVTRLGAQDEGDPRSRNGTEP